MKITKSYLKQIIKEEMQGLQELRTDTIAALRAQDKAETGLTNNDELDAYEQIQQNSAAVSDDKDLATILSPIKKTKPTVFNAAVRNIPRISRLQITT